MPYIYYKIIVMASVKQSWIKRYGEEEGLRRWNEQKKKYGKTKEQLRLKHGDDYVNNLSKRKVSHSLESCIERYGETLGPIKWQERLSKKLQTQKIKKLSGHTYKNGRTLQEYQERYGIEDGFNRWEKRNIRQSYMTSKQRYIDEYGELLGAEICKKIKDHSSLQVFIDKYGIEDGTVRYKNRNKLCAITEQSMIDKYGTELGIEKYKLWVLKVTETNAALFKRGYSLQSQILFWEIYKNLPDSMKSACYFAELNSEYQFFVNHENGYPNKIIRVDFKCNENIIEFDGSYWHNEQNDKLRDTLLITKGYRILRISDIEMKENKENCITKCINFLHESA